MLLGELFLNEQIRYYKGKHEVKVLTQSKGYWTVESLEDFVDIEHGETTVVKAGEQRIVSSNLLLKKRMLPPPIKEHAYELQMEKKLQQMVAKEEEQEQEGRKKRSQSHLNTADKV